MCLHVLHAHALPEVWEGTQVMSQAQKQLEPSARVRTAPAPVPRHSQITPVTRQVRSTPPPPPLAAYRRLPPPRLPAGPRLSVPPPAHLAIVPLWDDANLPLRPAAPTPRSTIIHWIGGTTVSLAVGALVAASLMTIRLSDSAQILPGGSEPVSAAPAAPVQLTATAPAQAFEADEVFELEPEVEQVMSAPQPVRIPEVTVTSRKLGKWAKATKRTKVVAPARKTPKPRGKRGRTMPAVVESAQPERAEKTEAPARAEPATAMPPVTEAPMPEAPASAEPPTAVPQPVVTEAPAAVASVEPPAPKLPETLTRDQVRGGLDKVRGKVLACTKGTYGRVLADVTVSAPGRVSNARIEGTFAGTKAAACMSRAIHNAKFPAFSGPDISVRYPFSF